jgi:hypothetical protein
LITVDSAAVEKRILKMYYRIRHVKAVEVGTLLSEWQTDDMHRQRPGTKRVRRYGIARTIIRPHSLYEMRASRKYQQRVARRLKSKRAKLKPPRIYLKTSTRPILRAVLLDQLKGRVRELAASIHW